MKTCCKSIRAVTLLFVAAAMAGGCAYEKRPAMTPQQLLDRRAIGDAEVQTARSDVVLRAVEGAKARYDAYAAKKSGPPPVIDILIISGGGDWGAFGAGFLKGWAKVPADNPLAKPEFTAVTGVSTGA